MVAAAAAVQVAQPDAAGADDAETASWSGESQMLPTLASPDEASNGGGAGGGGSAGGGGGGNPATTTTVTGQISFRYSDGQVAAAPGVTVTMTRESNGTSFTGVTNGSGQFSVAGLPVGSYTYAAQASGGASWCGWNGANFQSGCEFRALSAGTYNSGSIVIPAPPGSTPPGTEPEPEPTEPTEPETAE